MKKSVTKNYVYNVLYQIVALLTPLITTPYISRVLSVDGIGIYSYTGNVNAYFTFIAALGTAKYGLREIAYCGDNRAKRSKVFWDIEFLSVICVILSIIIYFFFLIFQEELIIYAILSINIFAVSFEISWLYQGVEDFGKVALRNCVIKLLYVLYVFLFVKTRNDLNIYILGLPLLTVLSNMSLWISLPKYVNRPRWRELAPLSHLKGTLALFIPTMAIQIYSALDVIMIRMLTSDFSQNGFFEQSLKLTKMSLTLVTSLSLVMMPRIANLYKTKQEEALKQNMYKTYRFLWFLGIPLCFGLMGVSGNIVPWFFGSGYDSVTILLKIMSTLVIAMGLSTITGSQYLVSIGRAKEYSISILLGMFSNIILNLIMIPPLGAIGAAVASVIAEFVISLIQFYFVRTDFSIVYVLKMAIKYLISGVIMAIVLFVEDSLLISSFFSTFIMICSGVLVYFTVLFFLRDSIIKDFLKRLGKE